jgi:integrase/recombinase XerD
VAREAALSASAEEYLSYLAVERGRAPNSITAYRRDLGSYERYLARRRLALGDVTTAVVEEYLAALATAGLSASSRARALAAIRGLHAFCLDERGATRDPTADVEGPRVPEGVPKALSEAEVERLLGAIVGDGPRARRDRAILELLYATGIRISELAGLSAGDLDAAGGVVRVLGKGSKERIVPVGRFALAALAAWLGPGGRPQIAAGKASRRLDGKALFISTRGRRMSRQAVWSVVNTAARRVGMADRVTPHVLRHSFATHLLDHGADIRVVQELLGHASITTTQVYTKVSQEHLRRVYLAAHPRARRRPSGGREEDAAGVATSRAPAGTSAN